MRRYLFAILALAAAGSVSGCGKCSRDKAAEELIGRVIERETGKEADVQISQDSMVIRSKEGELSFTAGESAKIPVGFPKDILVMDGSRVESALASGDGTMINLAIDRKKADVVAAYKAGMGAQGWSEEASMDVSGQAIMSFKKDARLANLIIGEEDGVCRIVITLTSEETGE